MIRHTSLLLLSFLLLGCGGGSSSTTSTPSIQEASLYFSQTSGAYEGGIDEKIAQDIALATKRIELAMYDFTNRTIAQALIEAKARGVEVEVVTDDSKIQEEIYLQLQDANITLYNDENPHALMHNKFLIVDQNIVWMGSTNFTYYAFYRNNEDTLRWESSSLALAYHETFNSLKAHQENHTLYQWEGVNLYFSPNSQIAHTIVETIAQAKESIYFMMYTFTNSDIAQALIEAKARGVEVKGIFDEGQDSYQTYSQYTPLLEQGLQVKLDANSYKLHHKMMIVDGNLTLLGSYNFTLSADEQNDENILFIQDENMAQEATKAFENAFVETK